MYTLLNEAIKVIAAPYNWGSRNLNLWVLENALFLLIELWTDYLYISSIYFSTNTRSRLKILGYAEPVIVSVDPSLAPYVTKVVFSPARGLWFFESNHRYMPIISLFFFLLAFVWQAAVNSSLVHWTDPNAW